MSLMLQRSALLRPQTTDGGPPPFHPLDLSPQWFFDAADAATLYAERTGSPPSTQASIDGVIGSWLNQGSAGGYWRSPTDNDRPLKRQDGSHYYVEPDGSGDHFLMPASLSGYDLTIVAVIRYAGTTNEQRILSFGRNGNSDFADNPARTLMTSGSGGLRINRGGGGSAALSADSAPQVVTVICQSASPRATIARNGGTTANDTSLWASDMSAVDQLAFARNASAVNTGVWSQGRLYMLFIKNAIVSGTDLDNLVAFAKTKAGIS